jgi:hypothetical protein
LETDLYPQKAGAAHLLAPITFPLTSHLSVRLYPDSRPNYLETAPLQKGLVLLLNERELVEEGLGFGVPVVKYQDKTYFAGTAYLSVYENGSQTEIKKTYILDTVSRKKLANGTVIDDGVYSFVRKKFAALYLRNKTLSPLFNRIMELRELAKIKTEFEQVKPRGAITVRYRFHPSCITVEADFSHLTLNRCQEILLLNEQGASTFEKYVDSSGAVLEGSRIGGWDAVAAASASLVSQSGNVWFSVKGEGGARLFRGWEHTKRRFSWAGLSYMLPPSNGCFEYQINLGFKLGFDLFP